MKAYLQAELPILPGGTAMERIASSLTLMVAAMAVATTVLTLMAAV
jgi:hypothetical protein